MPFTLYMVYREVVWSMGKYVFASRTRASIYSCGLRRWYNGQNVSEFVVFATWLFVVLATWPLTSPQAVGSYFSVVLLVSVNHDTNLNDNFVSQRVVVY